MQIRFSSRAAAFAVCAGLAALTGIVFGQTIHFPFINYDDPAYTYETPEVVAGLSWHGIAWAFTHVQSGNWHPLTSISHMLDCQLFQLNAGWHHLPNVILHGATAILLFFVLWISTKDARPGEDADAPGTIWPSAFVAAVFAVHPLRVESVAWVAERKDVLSGLFFMLTLLAYVWYVRRPSVARYAATAFCLALGLMSKPMLVTTPFVLLLMDYWPLRRLGAQRTKDREQADIGRRREPAGLTRLLAEKVPLFAICIASSVATIIAQRQALGSFEQLPLVWRMTNAIVSYLVYAGQTFWPVNLAVFYPHPENHLAIWQVTSAAVILAALTTAALLARKQRPYLVTGWLWYLGMLVPVIGLVQVGLQGHADRYTYLPQIGLLIAVTWLCCDVARRFHAARPVLALAAVIIVAALAIDARTQTRYWSDSESLWRHAISVAPNNYVAYTNLADLLMRRGRIADSIEQSEQAVRIHPRYAEAQNNLGLAYLQLGDERNGARHLQESIKDDPHNLNARVNLAWVLATSDKSDVRNGTKALELVADVAAGPGRDNPIVLRTLAAAYAENGRFDEAMAAAQRGAELAKGQGNQGLAADLERSIESYRAQQPLRSR